MTTSVTLIYAQTTSAAVFGTAVPDPVTALNRFSGPVIGAINGAAITGGFELALACDVLLASTEARFADTHARVGVMPGWGLSQKLSRAIGVYRAKELSLSGQLFERAARQRLGAGQSGGRARRAAAAGDRAGQRHAVGDPDDAGRLQEADRRRL